MRSSAILSASMLIASAVCGMLAFSPDRVFDGLRVAFQGRSGASIVTQILAHRVALGAAGCSIALLLGVALIAFRDSFDRRWARICDAMDGSVVTGESSAAASSTRRRGLHPLLWVVCLAAVALHVQTITQGFFLVDDFEFYRVNQLMNPLTVLLKPHGDHVMPLYRLEILVLSSLFGTNPIGWNVALLLVYALSLASIALVFHQLRIHPVAAAFALALFAVGPSVSSMLMGYYCLTAQLQPITFALLAAASYRHADATGRRGFNLLGHLLLLAASLVDITGIWVLGLVPLLSASASMEGLSKTALLSYWQKHRARIIAWVIMGAGVVCLYAFVLGVLHPDAFLKNREMRGKPPGLVGSLGNMATYLGSGVWLQMVFPFPHRLPAIANHLTLAGVIAFLGLAWRTTSPALRRFNAVLLAFILLQTLEIVIARPQPGRSFTVQLVIASHVLACLWLGTALHGIWKWARVRELASAFWSIFLITGALIILAAGGLSMAVYQLTLASAQEMRQKVGGIGQCFQKSVPPAGRVQNAPSLDARFLDAQFPSTGLLYGFTPYDLSFFQDFLPLSRAGVRLYKTSAISAWTTQDVVATNSLRDAVGEEFIEALRADENLRSLYRAGVEFEPALPVDPSHPLRLDALQGRPSPESITPAGKEGESLYKIATGGEWVLADGQTSPADVSVLGVDITKADAPHTARVLVEFEGDLGFKTDPCWWKLDLAKPGLQVFDLRQIPAFSLQRSLRRVSLRFETGGTYRIRAVELRATAPVRTVID